MDEYERRKFRGMGDSALRAEAARLGLGDNYLNTLFELSEKEPRIRILMGCWRRADCSLADALAAMVLELQIHNNILQSRLMTLADRIPPPIPFFLGSENDQPDQPEPGQGKLYNAEPRCVQPNAWKAAVQDYWDRRQEYQDQKNQTAAKIQRLMTIRSDKDDEDG